MKSDDELQRELIAAIDGLLFMSESDHPFEVVKWSSPDRLSPEHLRREAGRDADSPVEEISAEEFFRPAAGEQDWKNGAELAAARKYQRLHRLLAENLADVKVYRVGERKINVYVIGLTKEGNLMGVATQAIET
ncbi:MAG TPA: nuclease A inhibitor family protein [Pyrinomonadaceae bacterium]|nr:nuclease A inhibitor family protein [Pyrinomonadaceae bacterium]